MVRSGNAFISFGLMTADMGSFDCAQDDRDEDFVD